MKYLSQLLLLVAGLLLVTSAAFPAADTGPSEEEQSKQAIADEECN